MQIGMSGSMLKACRPMKAPFQQKKSVTCGVKSQSSIARRTLIQLAPATWLLWKCTPAFADSGFVPAKIRLDLAPDQSKYNPADERLRDAAGKLQLALNAEDVKDEERLWTELIEKYEGVDANWRADIVGRAYGNRGNARTRQGKMDLALTDYNKAIAICPWSVDPVLNRGVLYENTGQYKEAETDYRTVLDAAPNDPSGWNNMGNVSLAMGKWDEAANYYQRATQLAPAFSFAAANRTLALYAGGKTNEAMREMRTLLRRYPDFTDPRAALAAAEWELGQIERAEADWNRVDDPRYADRVWLRQTRRWPAKLVDALEAFLDVRSAGKGAPVVS